MNRVPAIIRSQTPANFSSALRSSIRRKSPGSARFRQVTTLSSRPQSQEQKSADMDKAKDKPNEKIGDLMSHSFGEGYATRSDEEGFGGIYVGNQSKPKDDDKEIHENHPAYDKNQGSEVKEKEKARHQTNASN